MRRGIRRIILTKSATLQLIWYPDAVLVPIRRKHENSPYIIIRLQRSTTYLPTRRSNLFITHPCVPPSRTLTYLERKIQATRLFRSQLAIVLSSHRWDKIANSSWTCQIVREIAHKPYHKRKVSTPLDPTPRKCKVKANIFTTLNRSMTTTSSSRAGTAKSTGSPTESGFEIARTPSATAKKCCWRARLLEMRKTGRATSSAIRFNTSQSGSCLGVRTRASRATDSVRRMMLIIIKSTILHTASRDRNRHTP